MSKNNDIDSHPSHSSMITTQGDDGDDDVGWYLQTSQEGSRVLRAAKA